VKKKEDVTASGWMTTGEAGHDELFLFINALIFLLLTTDSRDCSVKVVAQSAGDGTASGTRRRNSLPTFFFCLLSDDYYSCHNCHAVRIVVCLFSSHLTRICLKESIERRKIRDETTKKAKVRSQRKKTGKTGETVSDFLVSRRIRLFAASSYLTRDHWSYLDLDSLGNGYL
jgi:hypothetical protein